MIRVLVVDDQELIREGFRSLIDSEPDLTVVGTAMNGQEGVDLARELQPDVVVMDIRMPVMDGLEATRLIRDDANFHTRVLILTSYDDNDYVFTALRAGASGFLLKDAPISEVRAAIRVVASGDSLLARTIGHTILD